MTLVPTDAARCPTCGTPLVDLTIEQPALIRHAGYGATVLDAIGRCPACGWWVHRERSEKRP